MANSKYSRPKFVFTVFKIPNSYSSGSVLEVRVFAPDLLFSDTSLHFFWNSDPREFSDWFGFRMEAKSRCYSGLQELQKLMARIFKDWHEHGNVSPEALIERFSELRPAITEVVHDSRVYPHWVHPSDVLPETYSRWIDDYEATGQNVKYDAVCESREEAIQLIKTEATENEDFEWLTLWKRLNYPVRQDRYSNRPDIRPLGEKLKIV